MDGTSVKSERLLQIYSRLASGDVLPKKELAQQFHVTERSIQRDMESLRCFFAEQGLQQDRLVDHPGSLADEWTEWADILFR